MPKVDYTPHLLIEARAGTGKTTTLVEGIKYLLNVKSDHLASKSPSDQQLAIWKEMKKGKTPKDICFVAFNVSIAEELRNRIPFGCEALTINALGHKVINQFYGGGITVDVNRTNNILSEIMELDIREIKRQEKYLVSAINQIISKLKMLLLDCTFDNVIDVIDRYSIEITPNTPTYIETKIVSLCEKIMEKSLDILHDRKVNFDDQIWIPCILNLQPKKYDMLLIDEAQDLSYSKQKLVSMCGNRLIYCGDSYQAIYGFAGADSQSIATIEEELAKTKRGYTKLYLTKTRRCPKVVVEKAKNYVEDFEYFDDAPNGQIKELSMNQETQEYYLPLVKDGDMVLCRTNAPLIKQMFRFIKSGKKAIMRGKRDVCNGLIGLIEYLVSKANKTIYNCTVYDLIEQVSIWCDNEVKKEMAKKNPSDTKIEIAVDKKECIICCTDECNTANEVINKLRSIFSDEVGEITLSSIHKAKGLESKNVFILKPKQTRYVPNSDKKPKDLQEDNLEYVAITRTIENLYYVIE